MIEHAKTISLFVVIGLVVTMLANRLQSSFISTYLSENLITLLIALVAINTTTLSVVLTKIREISDQLGGDFSRTAKEMKVSIAEQVFLVVLAVVVQVISSSTLINNGYPWITFISEVIMVSIFAYAIYILYDTANSVFVILQFENRNSGDKDK